MAAPLLAGLLLSIVVMARSSNKWRLQFSSGAHSDGVIKLEITRVGGEPITVSTDEATGTPENSVAHVRINPHLE